MELNHAVPLSMEKNTHGKSISFPGNGTCLRHPLLQVVHGTTNTIMKAQSTIPFNTGPFVIRTLNLHPNNSMKHAIDQQTTKRFERNTSLSLVLKQDTTHKENKPMHHGWRKTWETKTRILRQVSTWYLTPWNPITLTSNVDLPNPTKRKEQNIPLLLKKAA